MPLLDMHSMPFICVSACKQYFCIQLMLFQKGVAGKSIGWRAFMQPKKGSRWNHVCYAGRDDGQVHVLHKQGTKGHCST